jgi:hypothetical protein
MKLSQALDSREDLLGILEAIHRFFLCHLLDDLNHLVRGLRCIFSYIREGFADVFEHNMRDIRSNERRYTREKLKKDDP